MDDDEGARRVPGDGARRGGRSEEGPSTAASARSGRPKTGPHPGPLPQAGEGEELRISPNKNRLLQVRRAGKRKLFDKARKEVFLEWFAATCNVVLSAGKAGVCDKTVHKHLLKDPAFVEAYKRALEIGYLRLEARQMQEAHRWTVIANGAKQSSGSDEWIAAAPPEPRNDGYAIRILDDEVVEEHFDPALAMQLLREHRRHLPGSAEKRPAQRTTARAASSEEVVKALAKRLKGFALRRGSGRTAG